MHISQRCCMKSGKTHPPSFSSSFTINRRRRNPSAVLLSPAVPATSSSSSGKQHPPVFSLRRQLQAVKDHRQPSSLPGFLHTGDSRGSFSGGFLLRLVLFPSKSHSSPPLHLFPFVGYLHILDHNHSSNTRRFLLAASVSSDLSCSGQQPTFSACFPVSPTLLLLSPFLEQLDKHACVFPSRLLQP